MCSGSPLSLKIIETVHQNLTMCQAGTSIFPSPPTILLWRRFSYYGFTDGKSEMLRFKEVKTHQGCGGIRIAFCCPIPWEWHRALFTENSIPSSGQGEKRNCPACYDNSTPPAHPLPTTQIFSILYQGKRNTFPCSSYWECVCVCDL